MEIVEVIKPKEIVNEFIEEKLKKAIKEVTPYKKPLVQSPKITRFFSQHTVSSLGNIVYLDLGGVCFFYLMLNRTFFELNAE